MNKKRILTSLFLLSLFFWTKVNADENKIGWYTRSDFNTAQEYLDYLNWFDTSFVPEKFNYSNNNKNRDEINRVKDASSKYDNQAERIAKIDAISRWETNYTYKNSDWKQVSNTLNVEKWNEDATIKELYNEFNANWWDANWWIWWNNLDEAKSSLKDQKENYNKTIWEINSDHETRINNDKSKIDTQNNKIYNSNSAQNKLIEKEKQNVQKEIENQKAVSDLNNDLNKKDYSCWWKECNISEFSDYQQKEANKAKNEANKADLEAGFAENSANTSKWIAESLKSDSIKANNEYENAVNEGWYTVAELNKLKEKKIAADSELKKEDYWCEWWKACNASEFSDYQQILADKARKKANDIKLDAEFAENWAKATKWMVEATNKKLKEAQAAAELCKTSPDDCKRVYSPKQIEEKKQEIAAKELAKKQEAKELAKKQADDAVNKSVENMNTVCKKWDTTACRTAIQDMRKKELDKACLESNSDACNTAKVTLEDSKNMTKQYVQDAKIAAAKAKAKADNEKANPWLKTLGSDTTMNALLWITDNNVIDWTKASSKDWWFTVLSQLTVWFKNNLSWFVQILSVWAFLFVWIRLALARWNPEEFKKALMHMIYVILWIFIIAIAWAAVVLVAWINI